MKMTDSPKVNFRFNKFSINTHNIKGFINTNSKIKINSENPWVVSSLLKPSKNHQVQCIGYAL